MEKTFCGKGVEVTLSGEQEQMKAAQVFGEIQEMDSQSFEKGQQVDESDFFESSNYFFGHLSYYEPDASGIRFIFPKGKWSSPEDIHDRIFQFVCYLKIDEFIVDVIVSSRFTITGITHRKRMPKPLTAISPVKRVQMTEEIFKKPLIAPVKNRQQPIKLIEEVFKKNLFASVVAENRQEPVKLIEEVFKKNLFAPVVAENRQQPVKLVEKVFKKNLFAPLVENRQQQQTKRDIVICSPPRFENGLNPLYISSPRLVQHQFVTVPHDYQRFLVGGANLSSPLFFNLLAAFPPFAGNQLAFPNLMFNRRRFS
jgi:hypothetical protein